MNPCVRHTTPPTPLHAACLTAQVLAEMTSSASEAALSAWNEYLTASKSGDVGKAIIAAAAQLTKARETIGSRLDTLSVSDAVGGAPTPYTL